MCLNYFANCICVFCIDAASKQHEGADAEEDHEAPNYEEKAQEIVQSILQEVVNTVAGGEICFVIDYFKEIGPVFFPLRFFWLGYSCVFYSS